MKLKKQVLITGLNSYIGNACEDWLSQWPDIYNVQKISVRDSRWKSQNWARFDAIIHVAGIAHNSSNSNLEELYYQVNRDLAYQVGLKAKEDGVNHFVNMSSIIIFGTRNDVITSSTIPNPDNFYGDSKLQGEEKLHSLMDHSFKLTHIRPPMVYGKESKGNFPLLAKLALKTPIFPEYDNKRSMIYIKNLTELIRLVLEDEVTGYIHPQNAEYVRTSDIVKYIAYANEHKLKGTRFLNFGITKLKKIKLINKVFGDLYYSDEMYDGDLTYQKYSLEDSILDIYDGI